MVSEISRRYAEALFQLAKENNRVEEMKEEAQVLLDQWKAYPELSVFFRAVQITDEEKKEAIEKIFASCFQDTRNFLKLLVDKDRMYYVKPILEEYVKLADADLGIERAIVASARPLDEASMKRIREALEKKTGKKINLINTIDRSLIAGIKVTAGNTVTDVTVARQIEGMKETLLKGGRV